MGKYQIHEWEYVQPYFKNASLFIGNGASIAVSTNFSYTSLVEYAKENNLLNEDVHNLFSFFKTTDFELILRLVWQATNVNKSLQIPDEKTHQSYINVREVLIKTVRLIHPSYEEVLHHLPYIADFIVNFKTVISLNYDLIVYWAIMYANEKNNNFKFKDCFINGEFDDNWQKFRKSFKSEEISRLVFYPHGNLIFGRNLVEDEFKVHATRGSNLLDAILQGWETEKLVPLFVSEGTSKQKIASIKNSNYLSIIYREVLKHLGRKIVLYGWGLGEQDIYILDRIKSSVISRFGLKFAISVYGNDQAYCNRVESLIKLKFPDATIIFFRSDSPGCWNIPPEVKE